METPIYITIAQDIMEEYDPDPDHARQVTRLALQMYDQLLQVTDIFDATDSADTPIGNRISSRDMLHLAALLHDIGWSVPGSRGHHKKSRDMILELDLTGVTAADRMLVAQIARYHRKKHPDPLIHADFNALDPHDRDRVQWLAAILRIADGLDRAHRSDAEQMTCRIRNASIQITVTCDPRVFASVRYGAELKKGLMEDVSGMPVTISAADTPRSG
jgi:exopolyphosphatase / guanosine-5'-triphosphate,3'-diphosphate pyrophosphatase